MTAVSDQPTYDATADPTGSAPPAPAGAAAAPGPSSATSTERPQSFEERMDRFGHEAGATAERWGKRAEAAGQRWSRDPAIVRAGDTAGRIWGLILLAIGVWFFADVTLGYDMPSIAWRDLWPIVLIAIGLLVLARGMTRRA
jgi:hypothetical protein